LETLRSGSPTRRVILGGSAAILASITGCTTAGRADIPPPGPEAALMSGAIQSEATLIALYDAVLATHPDLADRLRPLRDHHTQHLSVLKRHYVPGTNAGMLTPTPSAAPAVPPGPAKALSALRGAERRAASARADDATRAAPGLAQLLASIGACEAGHAQVLT
jgi:hypothetical protein